MTNLLGITKSDLEDYFLGIQEKKFKATQVYEWLYQKRVFDIDCFSNITYCHRSYLAGRIVCSRT